METEDKEKRKRLMLRQLTDVQMQAEKMLATRPHWPEIESFARSCAELNEYIRQHAGREDVVAAVDDVPAVEYTRLRGNLLQYMFIPGWLQFAQKRVVMDQIRRAREKYAIVELRLRGMTFDN